MKKYVYLLAVILMVHTAYAQSAGSRYLFENFEEGKLYYRTGSVAQGRLNVDQIANAIVLAGKDGEILSLTEPQSVDRVVIDNRNFVFRRGLLLELVELGPVSFLVQRRTNEMELRQRPIGAYGVATEAGSIQQYSSINADGGYDAATRNIDGVAVATDITLREADKFFVEKDGRIHEIKNMKVLAKVYTKEQFAQIERFCTEYGLGFKSETALRDIVRYGNTLE
jgi:hypothetical protein